MRPFLLVMLFAALIFSSSCHRRLHRERKAAAREAKNHTKYNTQDYIEVYKSTAIQMMKKNGIPASIILAQGVLESANGNSELARNANNHFGIKCTSDWSGKTYTMDDDQKNECFRRYPSADASYKDHSDFLKRPRYAGLFRLGSDDYKGWAKGLKKAGYATNPKYPQLLINIIEKYKLYKLDD
jgi:flagellum-specific peptidoglycan hydrolase FlgJ